MSKSPRCFSTCARLCRSHYDVLGVSPQAPPSQIKEKFYRISKEHHPDRNPADRAASAKFMKEASEAYSVLSDSSARRKYDATLLGPGSSRRGAAPYSYQRYQNPTGSYTAWESMNTQRSHSANYAWHHPRRSHARTHARQHDHRSAYQPNRSYPNMSSPSQSTAAFIHEAQRQARREAIRQQRYNSRFDEAQYSEPTRNSPDGFDNVRHIFGVLGILLFFGYLRSHSERNSSR